MDKLKMQSPDMIQKNIDKIAELFPNVITEKKDENGVLKKTINFEKLKQELADEVIEGEESYDFTWVGKKTSIIEANTPIRKTLRPCIEESKDWESTGNLYIEGDNLDVLKLLQESYLNSIKMIYIDPPYNTGNDFIYKDNFSQSKDEYEEDAGTFDDEGNRLFRNSESNGRFHSDWCSMLYPRLKLAHNLLREDGVIFISIDDNEVHNLRKICDEIFGEANFIGNAVWRSKDNSNNDSKRFSCDHNHTLVYSKNSNWQPAKLKDETKQSHFKNPDNDPKGPYFDGNPLNSPNYRENLIYTLISPQNIEIKAPKNGWRWSKDVMQEKIKSGEIRFNEDGTGIRRRTYLNDMEGLPPSTLWIDLEKTGHNRQAKYELINLIPDDIFDTPKPIKLIKYILNIAGTTSNDIILDFFSGSASTAHAIMQLNAEEISIGTGTGYRKYIMVQLQEPCDNVSDAFKAGYKNICEIGKERIRRAGEKIKTDLLEKNDGTLNFSAGNVVKPESLDIGFRVLKVDSTNMKDVYYAADEYDHNQLDMFESNIKDDRTPLDLLYQCLLDWGLSLSLSHIIEKIDKVSVHTVDNGSLVACFDNNVPENVVREIAKRKPLRVVFKDSSFKDSPSKINVSEIFKTLAPGTTVKVI